MKKHAKPEEYIRRLEESNKALRKNIENLKKENEDLSFDLEQAENDLCSYGDDYVGIKKENKKLREQLIQRNQQIDNLGRKNDDLKRINKNLMNEIYCGYENNKIRDGERRILEQENRILKEAIKSYIKRKEGGVARKIVKGNIEIEL